MESFTSLLEIVDFERNHTLDEEVTLDIIMTRLTHDFRMEK